MTEQEVDSKAGSSGADYKALSGRSLDCAIAEKVMGWVWRRVENPGIREPIRQLYRPTAPGATIFGAPIGSETISYDFLPLYSTDLNACFEALRKSGLGYTISNSVRREGLTLVTIDRSQVCEFGKPGEEAQTICRAMLAALSGTTEAAEPTPHEVEKKT